MSNAAIEVQLRELKDLTAQLNTTVKQQSGTISAMTDLLASKDQRIAELTEELRSLRKVLFGSSSERMPFSNVDMNSDQLNFLKELGLEPEPPAEIVEAEVIDVPAHQRRKKPTLALPFYRLEKDFEDLEAKIGRTSMANWSIQCNKLYFCHMTEQELINMPLLEDGEADA